MKSLIEKDKKKVCLFWILLICMTCAWGGIYDFCVAIYGVIFCISLICVGESGITIPKNVTTCGLYVMMAGFLVSCFSANDHGMAVIGLLRMAVICVFWLFWSNLTEERRVEIWNVIPELVSGVTALAILMYFVPALREYFFHAGRLGGAFQYSNTYALFLLIAWIVLAYRKRRKIIDVLDTVILISGILLCGSRSVMVFAIGSMIALMIIRRIDRKYFGIVIGTGAIVLAVAMTFSKLDLQRLLKLTLSSSTLNGRFLYWHDAITVMFKHPLGLGYMGYYFQQPQFQTGNYVTKYVHNDILQFGLDAGILAMAALCVLIVVNIFSKNNRGRNRFILIVLALHALFDFDLQYGIMFCILLMCMDTDSGKFAVVKKGPVYWTFGGLAVVFVYFATALGLSFIGQQKASLVLYPYNTFALESFMLEEQDENAAEIINKRNGMLASAHEVSARMNLENQHYESVYEEICDMVTCAGYDSYYYNQAVYYLSFCLDQAIRDEDIELAQRILEKIQNIPEEISRKETRASGFAHRINDKPEIELEEEIELYIERLSGVSLN